MPADRDGFARRKLLGILSGSWLAQACFAIVTLGVPDLLAGGPRSSDDLAARCGADPRALYRLLRALAAGGVLRQTGGREFALGTVGELLRTDAPGSAHLVALMQGDQVFRSFAEITHTVRTGQPAFEKVYGQTFYDYLDANPEAARTFNESMGAQPVPAAVDSVDLSGVTTLVDVGGGNGALLGHLLPGHPGLRGTLVERPDAIRRATERLTAAGLADRVSFVEGDFFAELPGGADTYVLSRVLHNWTDEQAGRILARVRAAMPPHARLIVLEELLPDPDDPVTPPAASVMVDLLMLVTLSGHDRSTAEYRALLDAAGFTVTAVHGGPGQPGAGAIEAVPG
ncbi:MAG TPA: methyltransferase [Micromonospora sp.]